MNQLYAFKFLIKELALKKAVTYTFTGFLALASHGRVSGRFRVKKDEKSIEINVTGNDKSPVMLKAQIVDAAQNHDPELLAIVQRDLDDASTFLDNL